MSFWLLCLVLGLSCGLLGFVFVWVVVWSLGCCFIGWVFELSGLFGLGFRFVFLLCLSCLGLVGWVCGLSFFFFGGLWGGGVLLGLVFGDGGLCQLGWGESILV